MIPPQPDFGPADTAALDAARLTVATTPVTWPASGLPRRAGVSAFGFGGTGVHLVVEEHTAPPARPVPDGEPYELVLTARDRAGLARYTREVARTITEDGLPPARVADTLARRAPLRERLALVARDSAEAAARLTAAAAALEAGHAVEPAPTPAGPPSAARRTPPAPCRRVRSHRAATGSWTKRHARWRSRPGPNCRRVAQVTGRPRPPLPRPPLPRPLLPCPPRAPLPRPPLPRRPHPMPRPVRTPRPSCSKRCRGPGCSPSRTSARA